MNDLGKTLILIGLTLTCGGFLMWSGVGKGWLGRLPGDFHYAKGDFSIHFPIATCLVISVILTVALWLFRK